MSRLMREMFDIIDKDITVYTKAGQFSGVCEDCGATAIKLKALGDRNLFIRKDHIIAIRDDEVTKTLDEKGEVVENGADNSEMAEL